MSRAANTLQQAISASGPQVAARLVEFRVGSGLSVSGVAGKTGLSRTGIIKIEEGRASPTVRTVESYVIACGRSLSEFFKPFTEKHKNGKEKRG